MSFSQTFALSMMGLIGFMGALLLPAAASDFAPQLRKQANIAAVIWAIVWCAPGLITLWITGVLG